VILAAPAHDSDPTNLAPSRSELGVALERGSDERWLIV
jgi:hypothetical protein